MTLSVSVFLWVVFGVGLAAVTLGLVTLGRQQVTGPWLGHRVQWQPWAWSQIMIGLFALIETVPRLAGASSGWALAFSGLAFLPLALSVQLSRRARTL